MALTLKQAKAIFILSKGDVERMKRCFGPEYREYLELNISQETEKEWLDEMIANGVVISKMEDQTSDEENFSIYEAHALFDLTDGSGFSMARSYMSFYLKYEEIVSEELDREWSRELIDSYYNEISQKEHLDIQEFRRFLELAEYPCLQENYDRALHLMKKILLTSAEDKFRLIRGLMGARDVIAQDGLAFWAYKYQKMDDVRRFMVTAYRLMDECRETASEDMLVSIEYYTKKWEEMMDIFELDKTACIEEAKRKMKDSGEETDFREQATQDIEDK